jgi:molybdopterin molybdotransferase
MISYEQSKKILKKAKIKIKDEIINSVNSLNRLVSKNVYSSINYPTGDNAAFDGYAINSQDTNRIKKKSKKQFKIIGSIAAGSKPFKKKIKKFDTIEIMTGGILPKGFDTIIPIEQINFYPNKTNKKYILIDQKIKKHNHIRFAGSDFKKGEVILKKNNIVQPNHILAFKTLGIKKIKVKKKINILFFSTGNEITDKDNVPSWKVRNSNSHYIKNLNENFLFNFENGGILKDNHQSVFKRKIKKVLNNKTDIIITSGAVSAGKYDYIPTVVKNFKLSEYFKSVAIRPGKPILFAKIKSKHKAIFGLPGNPMSSAACFRFFVIPYIENILGLSSEKPVRGILKNSFIKKKKFTRFAKSKLTTTKDGKIEVEILKGQESFRIKSFIKSNIWALLPAGKSQFKKGEIIDCFFPNHSNQTLI